MDSNLRKIFNAANPEELYGRMLARLEAKVGPIPYRVAETPLFLTPGLREELIRNTREILDQVSDPARLASFRKAIPARFDAPGMDELPNTAQVDFALVAGKDGALHCRLIELQGFASVYALMVAKAEAWAETLRTVPGLGGDWTGLEGGNPQATLDLIGRTLVGSSDPEEVALVDIEPDQQKTAPDFKATQQLFGIDSVCVTQLKVEGRRLFREKAGRRIPVRRIYNRLVFDELLAKGIETPFTWTDDLDVTWCSHPNWFWTWSKYCMPFLNHPAVPRSTFLSDLREIPADLSGYVLKPLYSFAGIGVVIDVTRADIERVPEAQRSEWVLQEKIAYAPALPMPDGTGVKAEVRVMVVRPPGARELTPVIFLVRLSRGKMHGVDHNKGFTWVGGTVGMWRTS